MKKGSKHAQQIGAPGEAHPGRQDDMRAWEQLWIGCLPRHTSPNQETRTALSRKRTPLPKRAGRGDDTGDQGWLLLGGELRHYQGTGLDPGLLLLLAAARAPNPRKRPGLVVRLSEKPNPHNSRLLV